MSRAAVILDYGHGSGTLNPLGAKYGTLTERELIEDYGGACVGYLAERGVAVTLRRVGPYEDRNVGWDVDAADLYVSCHVNAGIRPATATPYTIGLYLHHDHAVAASDVVMGFRDHVAPNGRAMIGIVDGSGDWGTRGAYCIERVPEHVPALVFEPGFIDHPQHAKWWRSPGIERVGVGLAVGILRALERMGK